MGFPTWLTYAARGKVQLLTANLFDTDLRTGKKTRGSLAKILETFSEGLAESLENGQQEKLPLPKPELFGGMDPLVDRVVAQTQARVATTPELIVCFNDYLIKDLVARFPDEKIGIISSTTPEENTNQLLQDFADGKIRILITSGRASYGADIKKSDGQFPDFHITVINPETQTAVNQSFGRLRGEKKESNFSLFFTEDFLKQLSTLFDEKKPLCFIPTSNNRELIKSIKEYKLGKNEEKFIKKLFVHSPYY